MEMLATSARLNASATSTAYLANELGLIEFAALVPHLGISRPGLNALADEPDFPKRVKSGRKLYVNEQAFRGWIAAHTSVPRAA
jgi:predicted DNA-binding transcriptional regulator AlpA